MHNSQQNDLKDNATILATWCWSWSALPAGQLSR